MEKCKKIEKGTYEYRGFKVVNHGYSEADHHVVWQGIDINTESVCLAGHTKVECLMLIDTYLDK